MPDRRWTNPIARALMILAISALSACSGAGALPGRTPSAVAPQGHRASDVAVAQPGDNMQGLPGDNMQGLPGENMQGLPGASFGCPGIPPAGSAKCTIAINQNVPPVP
ncbi:MAG TPA: hypothetical protein VN224_12200, partial [Xanthomonadales bacterium]|nr:hypothetical protein [Xanthomonadales bacterium]